MKSPSMQMRQRREPHNPAGMEERPASDPSETARADVAISDKARPRSRARTTLVGCGVIFVALLVVWATSDSYQSAKPETLGIEPKQIESPKSSPALAESRDPPPARRVAAGNAAPSRTQSAEKLDDAMKFVGTVRSRSMPLIA